VQVLRGKDRLHQLQRRPAAGAVSAGAREDSAAADFRHVALHQRKLQVAIKRARQLALIPYVTD